VPSLDSSFAAKRMSVNVRARKVARGVSQLRMAEEEKEPYPGYFKDMERAGVPVKKKKKVGGKLSMYKEDGTPYAPWMVGAVNEEEIGRKEIKPKTDAKGKLAVDPQSQELSGLGLKFKVLGDDEIEVAWSTSGEDGILGFVVQRRKGKETKWETVSDYKLNPKLKSVGGAGGNYSLVDDSVSPGSWVYRVSDISEGGKQNDLAQGLVEIESSSDAMKQKIALGVFIVLSIGLGALGLIADPQSGL